MERIPCDNQWCVYYSNWQCTVEAGIRVNAYGMCDTCIMAVADEGLMQELRRRSLGQCEENG